MNKWLLKKYLRGWREVEKFERAELRRTPLKMKLKQTLSLFQLGVELGIYSSKEDHSVSEVRSRWSLLKAGLA